MKHCYIFAGEDGPVTPIGKRPPARQDSGVNPVHLTPQIKCQKIFFLGIGCSYRDYPGRVQSAGELKFMQCWLHLFGGALHPKHHQ